MGVVFSRSFARMPISWMATVKSYQEASLSSVQMKTAASRRDSWVPVSSQAVPRDNSSTDS